MNELKTHLEKLASTGTLYEQEDPDLYGACGGNYDDAYSLGIDDGYICLARDLLNKYFKENN